MSPVARYCGLFEAHDLTPEAFARRMLVSSPNLCLLVMEAIGSWPSSEPELAALQRLYP